MPGSPARQQKRANQRAVTKQSDKIAERSAKSAEVNQGVALPFGMAPAPVIEVEAPKPVDLGEYDTRLAGWKVVFDPDVGLDAFSDIRAILETNTEIEGLPEQEQITVAMQMLDAMNAWVRKVVSVWNFVDSTGKLLPQPREGGVCPMDKLLVISRAFTDRVKPPKV